MRCISISASDSMCSKKDTTVGETVSFNSWEGLSVFDRSTRAIREFPTYSMNMPSIDLDKWSVPSRVDILDTSSESTFDKIRWQHCCIFLLRSDISHKTCTNPEDTQLIKKYTQTAWFTITTASVSKVLPPKKLLHGKFCKWERKRIPSYLCCRAIKFQPFSHSYTCPTHQATCTTFAIQTPPS